MTIMRRLLFSALLAIASMSIAACGDKDLNASIEKANEGIEFYNSGRITEAEGAFAEATSLSEDNHQAWYNLGQTREKLDKPEEAVQAFENAVRSSPEDAMYHYRLGKALREVGNAAQAETHLKKSVELNDRLYKAHYYLGLAYEAQEKPKEAAEAFTRAALLNPAFGQVFIDLGNLYIRWDKLAEAISVLDQGRMNVRDAEDLTDIYYALGMAYYKQGNWDKAAEAFSQAIEAEPSNLDALRQRGFAYAEKGDSDNARADLDAFVKAGGGGSAFHTQVANERLFRMTAE